MNFCETFKMLNSIFFFDQRFDLSLVTNVYFHVFAFQLMNNVNWYLLIVFFMKIFEECWKRCVTLNCFIYFETDFLVDLIAKRNFVVLIFQLNQQTSIRRVECDFWTRWLFERIKIVLILNEFIQNARKLLNIMQYFIANAFELGLTVDDDFIQLRLSRQLRVQIQEKGLKMLKQLAWDLDQILLVYNKLNAEEVWA